MNEPYTYLVRVREQDASVWALPHYCTSRRRRRLLGYLGGWRWARMRPQLARRCGPPGERKAPEVQGEAFAFLLRAMAPLRSEAAMTEMLDGIDAMAEPERAYWRGMVLWRRRPRRVLHALRLLLTAEDRDDDRRTTE